MVYLIQRYGTSTFNRGIIFLTFLVFVGAQIVLSVFIYPPHAAKIIFL